MLPLIPNAIISILSPQKCSVCENAVEFVADGITCRECWERTRIFSDADVLCIKCGAVLGGSFARTEHECHLCDDHSYDSARAAGTYEIALAATVIRLKQVPHIPKTARKCLIDAFDRHGFADCDLVVPVPLSARRLRERGFNQAALIARIMATASGKPLDENTLVRTVHTPMHRAAMDRKARELTVKNAFAVTRPKLIAGKNILLVDDVLTTGSTASHCAGTLKANGAGKVNVLTLARAF